MIVVLEVVSALGLVGFSAHRPAHILGSKMLAQAEETPVPTDIPPETPAEPPAETPATEPAPATIDFTTTPEAPADTTVTPPVDNVSQTAAVLSPGDLINSPDGLNPKSVDRAKNEDDQIDKTSDPTEQTKLLVEFATDKVRDMNNFTKSDDFASANFAAQRFNEEMDQAIGNLDKVPQKDQPQLRKQLTNFCDQADRVLRTVELSVPEGSAQDVQIARGQCQELNL